MPRRSSHLGAITAVDSAYERRLVKCHRRFKGNAIGGLSFNKLDDFDAFPAAENTEALMPPNNYHSTIYYRNIGMSAGRACIADASAQVAGAAKHKAVDAGDANSVFDRISSRRNEGISCLGEEK